VTGRLGEFGPLGSEAGDGSMVGMAGAGASGNFATERTDGVSDQSNRVGSGGMEVVGGQTGRGGRTVLSAGETPGADSRDGRPTRGMFGE